MQPVFKEALELSRQGEPFTIATVVRTKGSTPQKPGAKLPIRMAELIQFRLGGTGKSVKLPEKQLTRVYNKVLKSQAKAVVTADLGAVATG